MKIGDIFKTKQEKEKVDVYKKNLMLMSQMREFFDVHVVGTGVSVDAPGVLNGTFRSSVTADFQRMPVKLDKINGSLKIATRSLVDLHNFPNYVSEISLHPKNPAFSLNTDSDIECESLFIWNNSVLRTLNHTGVISTDLLKLISCSELISLDGLQDMKVAAVVLTANNDKLVSDPEDYVGVTFTLRSVPEAMPLVRSILKFNASRTWGIDIESIENIEKLYPGIGKYVGGGAHGMPGLVKFFRNWEGTGHPHRIGDLTKF